MRAEIILVIEIWGITFTFISTLIDEKTFLLYTIQTLIFLECLNFDANLESFSNHKNDHRLLFDIGLVSTRHFTEKHKQDLKNKSNLFL